MEKPTDIEAILSIENIIPGLDADSKEDVLRQMISRLHQNGHIADKEGFYRDVMAREDLGFTGAGNKVAIPHGISEQVARVTVAVAITKNIVKWTTKQDDIPEREKQVKLVVLFAVPKEEDADEENRYMSALKLICKMLANKEKVHNLMQSANASDVISILHA